MMSTFNSKGDKQNFTFAVKLLLPMTHKFEKTWLGIDFCWKFKIMSRMPTERFNPTIYRSTHWDSTHRLPTKPSQRLNTGIEDYTQKSLEEIVQNYSAMSETANGTHNQNFCSWRKKQWLSCYDVTRWLRNDRVKITRREMGPENRNCGLANNNKTKFFWSLWWRVGFPLSDLQILCLSYHRPIHHSQRNKGPNRYVSS